MAEPRHTPGRFVWHELFSNDIERSRAFYRGLFGWTVDMVPMSEVEYHLVDADGVLVAGMVPLSRLRMEDPQPCWVGYVSVADVDATARAAVERGGRVVSGPLDAGTLGRTVTLADPHGAIVAAWRSNQGDAPETPPGVGQFAWHQLATPAADADTPFYEATFGWKRELFRSGAAATVVFRRCERFFAGSVEPTRDDTPPRWLPFVVVPDLAEARARVPALGGTVLVEEVIVPEVGRYAVLRDNVGARIAAFEEA